MSIRVAVVTTGRADYGLLHPLLTLLDADERFDLKIIATGSHLRASQGHTVDEIEADGFTVFRPVPLPEGDDPLSVARAMGRAVSLLAEAIAAADAGLVVILGDRFEAFAAAAASVTLGVPIAHIHGGELTYGSIDDAFRHAITKMATLHFASADEYRRRILQMGEQPFAAFDVGALAVDNVRNTELMDAQALAAAFGVTCDPSTLLVTFHPITRAPDSDAQLAELLKALDELTEFRVLFTAPNVDAGGEVLRSMIEEWVGRNSGRAQLVAALGWRGYLSAASICAAVVGNSSSGVIEVPALGVPSVDIGDRQAGRVHPESVIHAEQDNNSIATAVRQAASREQRALSATAPNPYGNGHAAERIADALADPSLLERARRAKFTDLDCREGR